MSIWGEKIARKVRGALVAFVAAGTLMVGAEAMAVSYVAATSSDNSVHLLDASLADMGSFAAGASFPNGIATDGSLIWTGHPLSTEVIAYDFLGVEQFRWSDARLSGLQGMELVNGELATNSSGAIQFFDPFTGVFNRSIANAGFGVEGLAYDGSVLWQLESSSIIGINPADGSAVVSIANAASGSSFGGTGITANAPGQLTLAAIDGNWWIVSSADGSVINSGNNSLDMFGIKGVPGNAVPEPVTATLGLMGLGVLGMATRRRVA